MVIVYRNSLKRETTPEGENATSINMHKEKSNLYRVRVNLMIWRYLCIAYFIVNIVSVFTHTNPPTLTHRIQFHNYLRQIQGKGLHWWRFFVRSKWPLPDIIHTLHATENNYVHVLYWIYTLRVKYIPFHAFKHKWQLLNIVLFLYLQQNLTLFSQKQFFVIKRSENIFALLLGMGQWTYRWA